MKVAAAIFVVAALALSAGPAGSAPAWVVVNDASTPAATELTGIACVTTTRCFAVGYRETAGGGDKAVIEQGLAKKWSNQKHPNPGGARPNDAPPLSAITCPTSSNCFAVGTYVDAKSRPTALIHHWNGGAWGLMKAATPLIATKPAPLASQRTSLSAVTCASAKSCFAVGYYEGNNGVIRPLVERWTGKTWAAMSAPTSAAHTTVLQSVACASPTLCFAVGSAVSASHTNPYAMRWNGKAWATIKTPGFAFASLDDIACANAKVCFAIGAQVSKTTSTLLERWNGTKWSVVQLKNMPTANHLNGIACPTATRCLAVGRRTWTTAGFHPLALAWDGTAWTEQDPPDQPAATSNWLNSVSCRTATICRAAGTYLVDGTYHSFIQNYG